MFPTVKPLGLLIEQKHILVTSAHGRRGGRDVVCEEGGGGFEDWGVGFGLGFGFGIGLRFGFEFESGLDPV